MTTVNFSVRNEILGAIVRALAVQVAGFQVVGGMNKKYLQENGYYLFKMSRIQSQRLKELVAEYLPERFQQALNISFEP